MKLSTVISIVYACTFGCIFLSTSIYCAWDVKQQRKKKLLKSNDKPSSNDTQIQSKEETKQMEIDISDDKATTTKSIDYDGSFFKIWFKSLWLKKKIYWALVPHIFDQATDIGTLLVYQEAWNNYKQLSQQEQDQKALNPYWWFVLGICIIIFQKVISTITILFMLRNPVAALLQFVDLLMVKAVYINYKLGLNQPGNAQRYLALLECIFESSPQIILSMGWILKSSYDGESISPLVIASTIFSLWSITSKVAADDKMMIKNENEYEGAWKYKELHLKFKKKFPFIRFSCKYLIRVILFRFFEITNRINICVLS
eukprot:99808_1